MDLLVAILWPLSAALEFMLNSLHAVTGSYGLSIVLMAIAVSLLLTPVTAFARRIEVRDEARQKAMEPAIAEAKTKFSGREQFEKIDAIYQLHGYHPIQSMGAVLPLFIQLPFLIAALILLVEHPPLAGESFLFIRDLSEPDALIRLGPWTANLLPLAMTAVTVAESRIRPEATAKSRGQFLFVAAVLLVLIYSFPAGVCLYWLTSNSVSFVRSALRRQAGPRRNAPD